MPSVGSASGLRSRGVYVPTQTYQANDIVLYGPSTYLALAQVVGENPDTSTHWTLLASGVAASATSGQKWGTD